MYEVTKCCEKDFRKEGKEDMKYECVCAHTKASQIVRQKGFCGMNMSVLGVLETAVIVHQAPTRCCQNTFRY